MNILITGSASGLGYNAGINLAREGYHVFLTTENDKNNFNYFILYFIIRINRMQLL